MLLEESLFPAYTCIGNMRKTIHIGIDEVGRGPLAGPVTVGAVFIKNPRSVRLKNLRDSKKLSPRKREEWYSLLLSLQKEKKLFFATAHISPRVIDKINISKAANHAALRALRKLIKKAGLNPRHVKVLLDGGLRLPSKEEAYNSKTIIKGDEKIGVIALASIVAKVERDRYMVRASKKYLGYGFELHKGYGTKLHRKMIRKKGPSKIHRLTFLLSFPNLKHIARRNI